MCSDKYAKDDPFSNGGTKALAQRIQGLLQDLKASTDDKRLSKRLKPLLNILESLDRIHSREQLSRCEQQLRLFLLKCGLTASMIDTNDEDSPAFSVLVPSDDSVASIAPEVKFDPEVSATSDIKPEPSPMYPNEKANKLKDEGNKRFASNDFKSALLYYDEILAMNDVDPDIKMKAICNKVAALLKSPDVAEEKLRIAVSEIELVTKANPENSKCFYRAAELYEKLNNIELALICKF
jgi:tetratricopeptide (TPR) repeat protein